RPAAMSTFASRPGTALVDQVAGLDHRPLVTATAVGSAQKYGSPPVTALTARAWSWVPVSPVCANADTVTTIAVKTRTQTPFTMPLVRRRVNTMNATRRSMTRRFLVVGILPLIVSTCSPGPARQTKQSETIVWRPVGTWSGQGNRLTESFVSDTGTLRLSWETRSGRDAGPGRFRLTLHSGVSGRVIATVADQRGEGKGESIVRDDPRMYYAAVESAGLDWRLGIEEGIAWTLSEPSARGCAGEKPMRPARCLDLSDGLVEDTRLLARI